MALNQKISINKGQTSNYKISVRNDTGVVTKTNLEGYGPNNGLYIDAIKYFLFLVIDNITGKTYKFHFGEGHLLNPPVERIAYREDVDLVITPSITPFPDSIYTVKMITVASFDWQGSGFKGQDYLINVPGSELLEKYDTIITPKGIIYTIQGVSKEKNPVVFLDRVIEEDFEEFEAGYSTVSEPFLLSQDIQDCLANTLLKSINKEECDSKSVERVEEIRSLFWAMNSSMDNGDYLQSFEFMHKIKDLCRLNKCGCHG